MRGIQNYTFCVNIKSLLGENSPLECGDQAVLGIHFIQDPTYDAVEETEEECENII